MNPENKKITIIIYIAMLIIAIGGVSIAIYEKDHDLFGEEYIEIEHDDDDYEVDYDDEYEYDEDYEDDDYEVEEPVDDYTISIDSTLAKYTFTVSEADKEKLVNSSNIKDCMSNELYGAMFNEQISNDFKLYYTANQLVKFIGDETGQPIAGEISISSKLLLENAQKIFSTVELSENYSTEYHYFGTYKLSCNQGLCKFTQDTFGITSITPIDGYETKITPLGNTLRTQVIYIDEEMINYNYETDIYSFNAILKDTHNGPVLKTIENHEINLSQDINVFDEFSSNYDQINEYVYLFDSNNRLLSVTKSRLN